MTLTRRTLGVCLLTVALLVTGCQAPTADSGSAGENTTNATETPTIEVENGSLAVDPGQTFARVQRVAGTDVSPPERVRAFESSAAFRNSTGPGGSGVPEFWTLAGLRTGPVNQSDLAVRKNGYVTPAGSVAVYLGENATLADERMVLAHELTHYVQTQNQRQTQLRGSIGLGTTESDLVLGALIEGGAVYTTDEYMRAYGNGTLNSAWYPEIQESYPEGHVGRLLNARYIVGADYVSERADSPATLSKVYEDPPTTTEQVIHGDTPEGEPATPLSVDAQAGGEWLPSGTDQYGELFVRYALESELGSQQATRAAAGWGNDTLVFYQSTESNATGYVWVLDWDDAANDTEFRDAMTEALDERGPRAEGTWTLANDSESARVIDIGSETTAVVFGPERFVDGVSLSPKEQAVTITVDSGDADGGNSSSSTARGR